MGWEAVNPSLVEETKGTWQNKPQSPQKSADAHTQFCKKYQRALEWMVLSSLWASRSSQPVEINYFLTTNVLTWHSSKLKHKWSRAGFQWFEFYTLQALLPHREPRENPSQQSRGLCIKSCTGELRRKWVTTDGDLHVTLECPKAKSKFSYCKILKRITGSTGWREIRKKNPLD